MDIASVSTQLSAAALGQAVSIAVLKNTKNEVQQQGQELVQMLQQSVTPHLGRNLDIRA